MSAASSAASSASPSATVARPLSDTTRNILVTSALPYVNNVPHLGNIIGCVLSADVYSRFCKQRGYNTIFIGGTDEYGTTTEQKAIAEKTTPQEICERYYKLHKNIYDWFDISCDKFGRTSTQKQTEITQEIFWELQNNGFITPDIVEQLFCEHCQRFLADRFVEGICPDCKAPGARGDQCDACQHLINAINLKEPKCKICSQTPIVKQSKHLFLDLPKLSEKLSAYIEDAAGADEATTSRWSLNALNIARSWAKDLKPRCITRDLKWGTPVPLEGFTDKVFYVWFDAPIGYISITANYTDNWRDWWNNNKDVDLVQFLGKDNIPFHTVIFPSTLIGANDKWTRMRHISTTEYLNYENDKFSKSRGVGVFGDDAVNSGIPSEVWRYYLLSNRPENADSFFLWDELKDKNNNELLANLGNFTHRTIHFNFTNFEKKVPVIGELTEKDKQFIAKVDEEIASFIGLMERICLRDSLKCIMNISRLGNQFVQDNAPWDSMKSGNTARAATVEGLALNLVFLLSILARPFIPGFCKKVLAQINIPYEEFAPIPKKFELLLQAGHELNQPTPIFRKLEPEEIAAFKAKFSGAQDARGGAPQEVDLRIGQVLKVEPHPQSEHLYVLSVDTGDLKDGVSVPRTVVAGLRERYPAERLLNAKVLVVCNLKPSKLRGVESMGMILVGDDEKGTIALAFPEDQSVQPGTKVIADGHRVELGKKPLDLKALQKLPLTVEGGACCYNKAKLFAGKVPVKTEVQSGTLH
eukprot:TRINITY_DN28444_c0_g1_i1.p1 TRINITY_DN28444_c0_g1~~TRINITY_DN28444_c0_g1_i1.p1  ORF type:complete len:755 (+),score=169.30 TRINITY_DN28444_c0_g1_i1:10-2274(+)